MITSDCGVRCCKNIVQEEVIQTTHIAKGAFGTVKYPKSLTISINAFVFADDRRLRTMS